MVPLGAQADVTVYGRINNAIVFEDTGGTNGSTTDLRSIASRFGVKASSDLGNGLQAHGHYEFSTVTAEEQNGIGDTRIATAGISGGFGRVDVGNQWSAFFNSVGVDFDPTYWNSGIYGSADPYRSSNTIKYSNSVGPLALEVDLRLNDGKDTAKEGEHLRGTGGGVGLRVNVTDNVTLAAAFDTEDQTEEKPAGPETDRIGLSGHISFGQFWGKLAWSSRDTGTETDLAQLWVGADLTDSTNAMIGYGQSETDGIDETPSVVTLGLYHNMGGGLRLWYEGRSDDDDMPNTDNVVAHYAGIRYDF